MFKIELVNKISIASSSMYSIIIKAKYRIINKIIEYSIETKKNIIVQGIESIIHALIVKPSFFAFFVMLLKFLVFNIFYPKILSPIITKAEKTIKPIKPPMNFLTFSKNVSLLSIKTPAVIAI